MDGLIEKLEKFGKEKFIIQYRHELCSKTVNQNKIAAALNFDFDQSAIINHPPDSFSKCEKLYELIYRKSKVSDFLEVLEKTGNQHIIQFVQSTLTAGQSPWSKSIGIWFNIPEPIESFCGRENFLTQLHDKLQRADGSMKEVTVLSQVKIVSGLGGIGKTETSRRYISQYFEFYNNFIWVDAENENSMSNSFIELANDLKIPVLNADGKSREIEKIVKEIYEKICDDENSNLIVLDNAEDYQSCRKFFPPSLHPKMKKPTILATSRNQEWISPTGKIQVLPLDVLTDDESLEFISKQLEIPKPDIPELKEFIELIGGLPLALQQAVAFIKQEKKQRKFLGKPYEIKDYVQNFKTSMKKFQSFPPVSGSSATVFVTWNVTFEKIQKLDNGKEAVTILELLSFLYADKIPSTFLRDLVPEIKDEEYSGALQLLEKYSLVKINDSNFSLGIHRQLQFVILQYLKECGDLSLSNVVLNLIEKCDVILDNIKLSQSSEIFLNVHQIVKNQFNLIPVTEKFLDFMYQFGVVLCKASRYSESLELNKNVYLEYRDLLGENNEKTLNTQNNIAHQLYELGRYDESMDLYKETLQKEEIHLGVDHSTAITTKHNMALVLRLQEKYEEALELLEQILIQKNKIHGKNHPSTLNTQNTIATLYYNIGNFSKALELYQDLEEKHVEILGPDHKDVLITKHNKACVLYKMDQIKEASRIFNQIYEKNKEILGENHLQTISTLKWIAVTLEKEGKLSEALDSYKKVYEIRKTNLGENHPDTIHVKSQIVDIERQLPK